MKANQQELGQLLFKARLQQGLSTRALSEQVGLDQSGIVRMEQGLIRSPKPAVLAGYARALNLKLADLYALAGITQPTELPAFTPYLRSKFGDMPSEARAELEQSFKRIADKYGFDADGPSVGEDEH